MQGRVVQSLRAARERGGLCGMESDSGGFRNGRGASEKMRRVIKDASVPARRQHGLTKVTSNFVAFAAHASSTHVTDTYSYTNTHAHGYTQIHTHTHTHTHTVQTIPIDTITLIHRVCSHDHVTHHGSA